MIKFAAMNGVGAMIVQVILHKGEGSIISRGFVIFILGEGPTGFEMESL